ncbi:uncharacterized protein LOC135107207 [Scylla paramamosain]|uniref:uncharacterized protein LOC135107207 n=1 Tax=Scylla paramamosain TaxID=85552 RepID=UPI0030831FCC
MKSNCPSKKRSCTFPGREEWPVWDTKGRPGNPPASSSQGTPRPTTAPPPLYFFRSPPIATRSVLRPRIQRSCCTKTLIRSARSTLSQSWKSSGPFVCGAGADKVTLCPSDDTTVPSECQTLI